MEHHWVCGIPSPPITWKAFLIIWQGTKYKFMPLEREGMTLKFGPSWRLWIAIDLPELACQSIHRNDMRPTKMLEVLSEPYEAKDIARQYQCSSRIDIIHEYQGNLDEFKLLCRCNPICKWGQVNAIKYTAICFTCIIQHKSDREL